MKPRFKLRTKSRVSLPLEQRSAFVTGQVLALTMAHVGKEVGHVSRRLNLHRDHLGAMDARLDAIEAKLGLEVR